MAGRSLEKLDSAKAELDATGLKGALSTVQLEVTDETSIAKAAALIEQQFGRLDVLVNNAGVASTDPNLKTRLQECLDINVIGPALVSAAFRPLLLKSQSPYSIYVSSVVGSLSLSSDPTAPSYSGPPRGEAYRASKSAVNMIMLQDWVESKSTALKVFGLCPGFVRSGLGGQGEEGQKRNEIAGDPELSGRTILSVIQGQRDADVGRVVHTEGVYPW